MDGVFVFTCDVDSLNGTLAFSFHSRVGWLWTTQGVTVAFRAFPIMIFTGAVGQGGWARWYEN